MEIKTFKKSNFVTHEEFWSHAYKDGNLKSFNLSLRKRFILKYINDLNLPKNCKILDMGCGSGEISIDLVSQGYTNILGLDISEKLLTLAKKKIKSAKNNSKDISFHLGNVEDIQLDCNSFDIVIASGLIEWIKWDRWACQEMQRVLKPNGHLIVTVPNKFRLTFLLNLKRIFYKIGNKIKTRILKRKVKFERHWYTYKSIQRLLKEIDFDVIEIHTHGFGPFWGFEKFTSLSYKIFNKLQLFADSSKKGFIKKSGSSIIVMAQKQSFESKSKKWEMITPTDFKTSFKNKYVKEFDSLEKWKQNHPNYLPHNYHSINTTQKSSKTYLVLAPHPDDELIGCGGTIIKMKSIGGRIGMVYLTRGNSTISLKNEPESIKNIVRLNEAKNICESIGIKDLVFLNEGSSTLKPTYSNISKVKDFINVLKPDGIFVPFVNDKHKDHIGTNIILSNAIKDCSLFVENLNIFSYEVWSFVPPNVYVSIDDVFKFKLNELIKYKTGMKVVDYLKFCEHLSIYHSIIADGKYGHKEAFFQCNGIEYINLINDSIF